LRLRRVRKEGSEIRDKKEERMMTLEKEMTARKLEKDIRRERSAWEYYTLMASITHRIESNGVFNRFADVRLRNLKCVQRECAELRSGDRRTAPRAAQV